MAVPKNQAQAMGLEDRRLPRGGKVRRLSSNHQEDRQAIQGNLNTAACIKSNQTAG